LDWVKNPKPRRSKGGWREVGDLGLTLEEEAAIVAFLKTLSDGFAP